MTRPESPVFAHHVRVRYAETDQMGVAHHGSYIVWIEEARTEWMRDRGTSYRQLEESGLSLAVTRVAVRYRKPARYDDLIRIETRLSELHPASVTIEYRLFGPADGRAAADLIAEAETRLALIGKDGRPMRIPQDLF